MCLRKIEEKQILDLSSHYVVLGSGLNAISTIHGILDHGNNSKVKIVVIDASINNALKLNKRNVGVDSKMPSPKFRISANRYIYDNFKTMLNITSDGFAAIGSLAKGGLSNIWGGTLQPYSSKELSKYPYSYSEVKTIYSKIFKILTGTEINFGELENAFANNNRFSVRKPLLAINETKDDGNSCSLKSCTSGCIYCNKNVFNSSFELDELISHNKIKYKPGLFVKAIYYKNGYYLLQCLEVLTGKTVIIKAGFVYSCLGPLSTAKLVLKMSNNISPVPVLTTPGGAFFVYSFSKFHKLGHQILSSRTFSGKVDKEHFEGNIFPISENLLCTYLGEKIGRLAYKLFGPLFFSRVYIANIFFSSDLSSSSLVTVNDEVKISSEITPELKTSFTKALKIIKKELRLEGLWMLPLGKKLLQPGQDIHYGGLIPMKKNPQENQCNFKGELYGFKNFYIADAASMPFLASKGHSFNSMVNAYYIARKSMIYSNKKTAL